MLSIAPGSTSQSVYFLLRDTANGQPKTGLTASSPGGQASYVRRGGTGTTFPLVALAGPTSAWTSGGFVEVSAVNTPGVYRLDVPDAAFAAGAGFVGIELSFTGALSEGLMVQLVNPTNNVGAGSISCTVTVRRSDNSAPIAGAAVWISTDAAGTNVIAGALYTNANGQATFLLDAGNYHLWVQAETYTGTNPTAITVS